MVVDQHDVDHRPGLSYVPATPVSSNAKVEPAPGLDCTVISEPWARTIRRARYRPNPTPAADPACPFRPRANLSKMRSRSSGWIPGPWSDTSTRTRPPYAAATRSTIGL